MTRGGHMPLGLAVAFVVLVADQASKWWVLDVLNLPVRITYPLLPTLNLTFVRNPGITFGLFRAGSTAGTLALTLMALIVIALLVLWLYRAERWLMAAALGSVCGGAVGNVIDRLRFGWVVDFIHAHTPDYSWSWYVFNLADSAIVCGVAVLALDGVLVKHGDRLAADPPGR